MKGNELEIWIASLTTCNFITVRSKRWILVVNKLAQFLQPILSGSLGRSRRCPLNRGFTLVCNILYVLFEFKHAAIFLFSRRLFAKHHSLSSLCQLFTWASLDRTKLGFYQSKNFLFIVVMVISLFTKSCILTNFSL